MIFDERDLEEEKDEDKTPQNNQMMFDDLLFNKKSETNSAKTNEKSVKKEKSALKTKEEKIEKNEEVIKEIKEDLSKEKPKKVIKKSNIIKGKLKDDYILDVEVENNDVLEEKSEESSYSNIINNNDTSNYNKTFETDAEGNILKSVKQVMNEAMLPYSEYVILDRALPRVEDGLKPVQRRILYSMYNMGLTPDKSFTKSAKIVGDVLANYHPHGDSSVYNAMVKLAQNFNMRETLVLGHGNFGSMDGDPAAAYRYTEAKLNEQSIEMLKDIEKETVNFSFTYDDSKFEPDTLPSRFPNILVNGTMGIAVGIATNFACHNLGESIDACISYIDNPNISVDELMQILKGPDFPTGGIIVGDDEIKKAYETGKGKILIRAKIDIEQAKNDKINLIISEFPYQVNKAMCLQKIYELKEGNKDTLNCITDIRDESDRTGVRAVITLKKDCDPQKIINYLYKYSDLQVTFGINMVAIAEGKPKLLSLKDILSYYTKYQRQVVLRRTNYDLNVAKERQHILLGLIVAIENIDEIVKIIKKSASTVIAKQELKKRYELSERQAQAIMDMRLSRLTNLEVEKLREEISTLEKLISKLTKISNSEKLQYNLVKEEMLEIKKKFNDKRRTKILKDAKEITEDDLIKVVKKMYVLTTEKNAIKKIPEKTYLKSTKIISSDSSLNEIHSNIVLTDSDKNVLLFTNLGNIYKVNVEKIIEARFKDRGIFLKDLILGYTQDEKVVLMLEDNKNISKNTYIFFTKNGLVKLTKGEEFIFSKNSSSSIKLKDDEIINIQVFNNKKNMMFITKAGMGLFAKTEDVPVTSKTGQGVKGISLNDKDSCIFASLIEKEDLVVITNKGFSKKLNLSNFELLAKNRKGVKVYSLGKGESVGSSLVFAKLITKDEEIFVVDNKNKNYIVDTSNISQSNRVNKGNILIKDRKLIEISKVFNILTD